MEKRPLQILLVDDDEDDYIITEELLREIMGYQYHLDWVNNYPTAWQQIEQKRHDLYLIDYRLGPDSGLELLRRAVALGVQAPIILLTGQGDREVDLEAMKAGAADYLVKGQMDPAVLERSLRYGIERKRVEGQREALLESERRLNQVTQLLNTEMDMAVLWPQVVQQSAALIGAEAGALALLADDGRSLHYHYLFNLPPECAADARVSGEGVAWHVLQTGQALLIPNYAVHPQALPYWQQAGVHSYLGVPLVSGGQKLGVLALFTLSPQREISPRQIALIESVGQQMGVAMHNARLFAEVQQRAAELQRALTRLEELDRLKSAFIRNASHELRTPLAIVRGYIELLGQGEFGELTAAQRDPVETITMRAQALSRIVDDMTAVWNVESMELTLERMNLRPVVQTAVAEFRLPSHRAQLQLNLKIAPNLADIMGSLMHLTRVVDNLLGNAIKFTPPGGAISVTLQQHGKTVILDVVDTGIGIPEYELERIFDRFYQIDDSPTRRYGGTGLGLALVKEIVEAHRGVIQVNSVVQRGSRFRVVLPCVSE